MKNCAKIILGLVFTLSSCGDPAGAGKKELDISLKPMNFNVEPLLKQEAQINRNFPDSSNKLALTSLHLIFIKGLQKMRSFFHL